MLLIPEMAMSRSKNVITVCKGEKIVWTNRDDAKEYFLENMIMSDGEEYDRYECIYIQLIHGLSYCKD